MKTAIKQVKVLFAAYVVMSIAAGILLSFTDSLTLIQAMLCGAAINALWYAPISAMLIATEID